MMTRHVIGVISDTHGLLRPQVHDAFLGVESILHAGDVCGDNILIELATIAPVQAVFGNNDLPWDPQLIERIDVMIGGIRVHVSHGHEIGRPKAAQIAAAYPAADVVVYGHTHVPVIERIGRQLVINPGAAGPRRFRTKPTVAKLTIVDGKAEAELIELE